MPTLVRPGGARGWLFRAWICVALACVQAKAGPPYVTDDPEPTDYGHYEAYVFASGSSTTAGTSGAGGIDFSYGAGPDLQLTMVAPVAYDRPNSGSNAAGLGNIELAAKYRWAHQRSSGWDASIFPRLFLPGASHRVGSQHAAYLLPIWIEKDWGDWSTFGGGGYVVNRSADAQDFILLGWAICRQLLPELQIGAEIYHRTADTRDGLPTTGLNAGIRYDLDDQYHVIGSYGPGIQNAAATNLNSWYLALLVTI